MTDDVRDSYDDVAELYASLFLNELDQDTIALDWIHRFAGLVGDADALVADLGCGPGQLVRYLEELGLTAVGYDLSSGQVAQARATFPDSHFEVGDFADLGVADSSLGGVVARYSIIHLLPTRLARVFEYWHRLLAPGAPVLISFFASTAAETHGRPFDHAVVTAYELFPETVARHLHDAGFVDVEIGVQPPPDGGRPFNQGTVLARTPPVR
ncbi:MAG: class I SAM-dependent methyltransferase [Acidimicrobiales bacterium]